MSAIDFVVRGDAGVVERGAITGSGNIIVGAGQDISLNLQRSHILSYMRQGQALQITLVDGQVITIEGFFDAGGAVENQLFISSSGQLAEVQLTASEGNLLFAQYADADSFGKWSPDDDLYFVQAADLPIAGVEPASEAGMLGVPLMAGLGGLGAAVPIAAAAGIPLLLGGGSDPDPVDDVNTGGGGGGVDAPGPSTPDEVDPEEPTDPVDPVDPVDPPVVAITEGTKSQGHVVNDDDHSDGVTISGSGTPGASGTVTVGDATHDVTVDDDGNWTVTFDPTEVEGGEYEVDVTVTLTNEGGSATTSDVVVIDTFTTVSFDASTVEGEGVVNFDEEADGVVLTGTTQEGSSVVVSFGGNDYTATVTGGSWSLDVPAGTFAQGEYDVDITVTATDAYGNTASTMDTLHIDTITNVTVDTSAVGGDNTINMFEHESGATVVGTAQAYASVEVTMNGHVNTVQADADGNWTTTYTNAQVPTGTLTQEVTAVATDAAGNTATASGTFEIDTELDVTVNTDNVETDGVVNMVERSDGVTLTGTSDAGANVQVVFENGVRNVVADNDGNWSADFAASEIRTGDVEVGAPVQVTATDAAGNVATTSGTVQLDTYVNRLANVGVVEGDDIVSNAEAADGITLQGVVEQGSTVNVTFEGVTHAATVNTDGTWSVDFAADEIPSGEYVANVVIEATDAAGNTASITDTFTVDTVAPDAPNIQGFGKDHEGVDTVRVLAEGDSLANPREFHATENGGDDATALDATGFAGPSAQTWYEFPDGQSVPDGSHIVVTDSDAAGNSNSTLFVLDDINGSTVDVTGAGLDGFNIGAIDLEFAEDSELTLSLSDLEAMSQNDNTLIIHGNSDDTVTLETAATAAGTTTIDSKTYDVYTVGDDGGKLIIGEDVNLITPVV
ncbi:Ig-like domain-containing protein [Yoonia sp. R2331]|uniref:BapA/Bap/LapF family prefix-like domain-containing protein n=1 Tax=Yoonia sp. R2331 TaxID=3237238 RepID=UPI0034E59955